MLGRLIIALIVIVAAMVMTRSKEELDGAELTRELATARVAAAEARAAELEETVRRTELRSLEAEHANAALKREVAELQDQVKRRADPEMVPGETEVIFGTIDPSLLEGHLRILSRIAKECAVDSDGRGVVRLRIATRPDGIVTRVDSRELGDRLGGIARCLKAEAGQWRFPRPDKGESALLTWELHFNDPK